jgi:hypothetical protein
VVSVDDNGNERWHYVYSTPSSEPDPGRSIVYGLDGNIYVAGFTGPEENTDVTVISLIPSGSERWTYLYNGPGNYYDFGECIIYGSDGNLYIFGSTCYLEYPGYTYWNGLTISLSNSGNEHWTYMSSLRLSWFSQGVYGGDGNLYTAGTLGWDIWYFLVESISNSGNYRWRYIDTTWGWASSVTWGEDGNIYVGGKTSNSYLPSDTSYFTIMKFTPDGSILWSYRYNQSSYGDWWVSANALVYAEDGNIYASGVTYDSTTGDDFTVISLTSAGIQETNFSRGHANEGMELSIQPAIIHSNTQIQYSITEKQTIRLRLYDIVGRKIETIAQGVFEPGVYTVNYDFSKFSSGIYFLILEGEKGAQTQKILILR